MTKQGDKLNYTAQGYSNAETVGSVDGTTVFVPYMIVGEKATVRVNYAKKGIAYADVLSVDSPSAMRRIAPCKYFGKCGGCTLMHMQYTEQLVFKHSKVVQNLKKIASIDTRVLPTVASSDELGYRNKLSLPVRGKVGNVQIGMYRKGSHDVVDCQTCMLGDGWTTVLVQDFRDFVNNCKIKPYNEHNFTGLVRHLVARYVDGQLLVTVVVNGESSQVDLTPFAQLLGKHFEKFGLFVNENTQKNNVILGKMTKHICGLQYIEGTHLGIRFRLRPDSFFQVNNDIKDKIYQKVRQLLDVSDTQVLVDCFSGIGILTNVLASADYQTFAVEIEPSAVTDADEMKQLNSTPNLQNICGDATVCLPQIAADNKGKVMSLVVDPPRKGLGEKICNTIVDAGFDNIVYISCDSATLARDLSHLVHMYDIDYIQPFDMFPNTAEVETVVHLIKK